MRRGGKVGSPGLPPEKVVSAAALELEGLSRGPCQTQLLCCAGSCPPVLQRVAGMPFPNRMGWGWVVWQVNLVEERETWGKACLLLIGAKEVPARIATVLLLRQSAGRSSFLSPASDKHQFFS